MTHTENDNKMKSAQLNGVMGVSDHRDFFNPLTCPTFFTGMKNRM